MILRIWAILSVILCVSTLAFEYNIELDRCNVDTTCVISKSCLKSSNVAEDSSILYFFDKDTTSLKDVCETIIQIKVLTMRSWLVLMQVEGAGLVTTKGMQFTHGGITQISCLPDSPPSTKMEGWIAKFDGGNPTRFKPTKMFCSIIVTSVKDIDREFDGSEYKSSNPEFHYAAASEVKVVLRGGGSNFWKTPRESCSLERVTSQSGSSETSKYSSLNIARPSFSCADSKKLIVITNGYAERETASMTCENKQWTFEDGSTIPDTDTAVIGCVDSKFCNECSPLEKIDVSCPTCIAPVISELDGCKIAKCERSSQVWTLDARTSFVDEFKCKKSMKGDIGVWVSSEGAQLTKASCIELRYCEPTRVVERCDAENCLSITKTKGFIECPEGDFYISGVLQNDTHRECDTLIGLYRGVAKNDTVCCGTDLPPKKEEKINGAGIKLIAGIVGGILLAVALFVLIFCYYRRSRKKTGPPKKGSPPSRKMEGSEGSKSTEGSNEKKEKNATKKKTEPASEPNKDGAATGVTGVSGGGTIEVEPATEIDKIKTQRDDL